MRIHRFINALAALILVMAAGWAALPVSARVEAKSSPNSVMAWNAIAIRTIVTNARHTPSHAIISMAYVHAAVYDAVVAIEGEYQPYAVKLRRYPNASIDAAVAAAAHDVLVHYFPAQQADLDADYTAALAAVPTGRAKTDGVKVGKAAAAGLIKLRQGDGYQADIGFVVPLPSPGVWQPLPGQTPLIPWLSEMKPFTMMSDDQFRPAPPPALTSAEYVEDYNEVKEVGRVDSLTRTADQTDASRFFTAHAVPQYNAVYKTIIQNKKMNAVQAARLYAMGNVIPADANIACYDAKYEYLYWRPLMAIQQGDSDGNPNTAADATWLPLIGTPPFPEYVSGHGCFTSSFTEVLANVLRTRNINIDLVNNAANVVTKTRHYDTVNDLKEEIINVRVWSGIHFRTGDEQGVAVGTNVTRWALKRYFLPIDN